MDKQQTMNLFSPSGYAMPFEADENTTELAPKTGVLTLIQQATDISWLVEWLQEDV